MDKDQIPKLVQLGSTQQGIQNGRVNRLAF